MEVRRAAFWDVSALASRERRERRVGRREGCVSCRASRLELAFDFVFEVEDLGLEGWLEAGPSVSVLSESAVWSSVSGLGWSLLVVSLSLGAEVAFVSEGSGVVFGGIVFRICTVRSSGRSPIYGTIEYQCNAWRREKIMCRLSTRLPGRCVVF